MEIEAKPTEYAGVLFRSKLEATWARFFDVIQLDWEYEPYALAGWIPDFLLDGWWLHLKPSQNCAILLLESRQSMAGNPNPRTDHLPKFQPGPWGSYLTPSALR